MSIGRWECCGRTYVPGIKKCRQCGKVQPTYGILDDAPKDKRALTQDDIDYDKVKDPHIGGNEKMYVSCMPK